MWTYTHIVFEDEADAEAHQQRYKDKRQHHRVLKHVSGR